MRAAPSRAAIVGAIVLKDLKEFSRDRVWMILTPLSIAFLLTGFWFLPTEVNESLTVGLYPPELARTVEGLGQQAEGGLRGLEVVPFEDEQQLAAAVRGELQELGGPEITIGIAFPRGFADAVRRGEETEVSLYVGGAVPVEIRNGIASGIREIAYGLQAYASGLNPVEALPVTVPDPRTIVLGEDRAGTQVPLREKLLPMLLVVILMMEAMALGGLVAIELTQRTMTALLTTPARVADVLAAKALVGTILGLGQGLFFLLATGSIGSNWLLVTFLLLSGATMASAVGMITGAAGKDFMNTLFLGVAFVVPLLIPAIASLLPGSTTLWVRALPSHGLVEAMVGTFQHDRGWVELAPAIGATLAWTLVLLGTALFILKRKVEAL